MRIYFPKEFIYKAAASVDRLIGSGLPMFRTLGVLDIYFERSTFNFDRH